MKSQEPGERYRESGFVVVRLEPIVRSVERLRERFISGFREKFTDNPSRNRNLIKRFGDATDVARVFSDASVEAVARSIGIAEPVFCGPIVTHYTSHDVTGAAFGLPFHQDWPSMGSSRNGAILWFSLLDASERTHSVAVLPGRHREGLLPGQQLDRGYVLDPVDANDVEVLDVKAGELLLMSPFLPHKTFVNPDYSGWKLSLSRRMDDLSCPSWAERGFGNAYGTSVDRNFYLT